MSQASLITMTDNAKEHVLKLISRQQKPGLSLRVAVVGGGCSGMSYKMSFDEAAKEGDQVIDFGHFKAFVDPKSALFLSGIQIDFSDGLDGAGFTYMNPNAKKSCGCGTSFSA